MQILPEVETPTPEQIKILTDDGIGYRLIRGAAGSGKTTAALMRLRQLIGSRLNHRRRNNSHEPINALVLTFNKTLSGYVSELARGQDIYDKRVNLAVKTFASWAKARVGKCNILSEEDRKRFLERHIRQTGIQQSDQLYFEDEISYILGRFGPTEIDDYLAATRSGRGRSPVVRRELRQRLLESVVRPYVEFKKNSGQLDWNDLALRVACMPTRNLDILIVDETQDMSANQIRAMISQLKRHHTCTFIVDAAQRIYPQSFTWKEVGLTMTGRHVIVLNDNFRNTIEIARFATGLVQDLDIGEDGVVPRPDTCERSGPIPLILQGKYNAQIAFMLEEAKGLLQARETIAFIKPLGGGWFDHLRQELTTRGIAYCELTRKDAWPRGEELVALSTIHSVKGLEFDHIMIPGLSQRVTPHGLAPGDGTLEQLRRLLAMGIGRARKSVTLGYKLDEASSLIEHLDPGTFRLKKL